MPLSFAERCDIYLPYKVTFLHFLSKPLHSTAWDPSNQCATFLWASTSVLALLVLGHQVEVDRCACACAVCVLCVYYSTALEAAVEILVVTMLQYTAILQGG